ncbi:hypothetical protein CERSUDRAFT_110476 [Gelatoporia subvermispora B]|uniref:Uncharacterized protein n=1 Tax=Ceriporiopsis subvermispora (strain B) TaxID=914234 RepID=M2PYG3_CERS8|nr:hypothetical protein CERSUDRAFT_110476 [Gelatoporia subvermispora B]
MDPQPDLEIPRYGHARSESRIPLLKYADYFSPPLSPKLPTFRTRFVPSQTRLGRVIFVTLAFLSAASLITFATFSLFSDPHRDTYSIPDVVRPSPEVELEEPLLPPIHEDHRYSDEMSLDEPEYSPYVVGPPTESFRDNLRNDTKYITSWISAGWTNDVMTYANMVYLGSITDRVAILPMFIPSHIGGDAGDISFGEVFDVPRFIRDSGIPAVEWSEVKDPQSEELEPLGCWNVWEAVQYNEHHPRHSWVTPKLGLDVSYTTAPDWVKMIPNYEHDHCSTFWALAKLSYPEERLNNIGHATPSLEMGFVVDPDDHLLCYDFLYYAGAAGENEFDHDFSPAWRYVARHFRWTSRIEGITSMYIRRAFGLSEDADVPPYIAIHVRHGDFGNWCWQAEQPEDCFAPIPVIARRVREVQDELRRKKGIDVPMTRVIITSDEKDEAWWNETAALGWVKIDHDELQTAQIYGRWYPVVLDAAIHSYAQGFVGTDRSTFSVLSRRRVEDWQDGVTRTVKWGYKDADAH